MLFTIAVAIGVYELPASKRFYLPPAPKIFYLPQADAIAKGLYSYV